MSGAHWSCSGCGGALYVLSDTRGPGAAIRFWEVDHQATVSACPLAHLLPLRGTATALLALTGINQILGRP
ncbi:hypothetical protein G3I40_28390 [Streptomyces sp. SID14478]|uniref:hypothetical protein n=1 Tax=Streptomyces sp. SID14478 TaxID=2706073 RepID=UPI0013D9E7BE|nr:hypothetical protein [Streptomyces sp. SID14478]NEB79108.1 hypothetical protein [Streptomyces sp. SID14478]